MQQTNETQLSFLFQYIHFQFVQSNSNNPGRMILLLKTIKDIKSENTIQLLK